MVDRAVASSARGGVIRQNRFGGQYRDPFARNVNAGRRGGGGGRKGTQGTTINLEEQQRLQSAIEQVNREAAYAEAAAKAQFSAELKGARGIEGRFAINQNIKNSLNAIKKEATQRIETLKANAGRSLESPRLTGKATAPSKGAIPKSVGLPDPANKGRINVETARRNIKGATEGLGDVLQVLIPNQKPTFVTQVADTTVPSFTRGTTPTRSPRATDKGISAEQRLDLTSKDIQRDVATGAISSSTAQSRFNRAQERYEVERAKADIGRNIARGAVLGAASFIPGVGAALGIVGGAQLGSSAVQALRFRPKVNKTALAYEIGAYTAGGFLAGGLLAGAKGVKNLKSADFDGEPVLVLGAERQRFIAEARRLNKDNLASGETRFRTSGAEVYDIKLKDGRTYRIVQQRKGEGPITRQGLGDETGQASFTGFELIPQAGRATRIGRRIVGASESISGDLAGTAYTRAVILKPQGTRISRLIDRLPGRSRGEVINILEKIEVLSNKQGRFTGTSQVRSTTRVLQENIRRLELIDKASELAKKNKQPTIKEVQEIFNLDRLSRGKQAFTEAEFQRAINERVVKGKVERILNQYKRSKTDSPNFQRLTAESRFITKSEFGIPSATKQATIKKGTRVMKDFGTRPPSLVDRYKAAQANIGRGSQLLKKGTQRTTTLLRNRARSTFGPVRAVVAQVERQVVRTRPVRSFVNTESGGLATSNAVRNRNKSTFVPGRTIEFTRDSQRSSQNTFQNLGLGLGTDQGTSGGQRARQAPFSALVESQASGQAQRSAFVQKARQEQRQQQQQRNRQAQRTRLRTPTSPRIPFKTKLKIPPSLSGASSKKKTRRFFKPKKFEGFVRRKGKFFSVTKTPTTRRAALGQALKVADTTLGASVIVRESKRPGFARDVRAERSTRGLLRKFGPSKRDSGILVEKSRFRLESRGRTPEVREIRGFRRRR